MSVWTSPSIVPYPFTLAFAVLLGYHGRRSGSLALDGALAASLLGYLTLANPLRVFGVALLVFYFSGSRITKIKAAYKATLEEEPSTNGKPGGNRSAAQVCCNALVGTCFAVAWRLLYSGELADGKAWTGRIWLLKALKGHRWCALDESVGWSSALVLGAIAFWGACAGDTFASELGILAKSSPILITTFKVVPPGTNGGVSAWGTLMSLTGGLLIGVSAAICLWIENPECGGVKVGKSGLPWWITVVAVGAASGLIGSLLDSYLGATLQESLYSNTSKKIVHVADPDDDDVKVVAGKPVLTNNGVNFISAGAVGLATFVWFSPQGRILNAGMQFLRKLS
ncbi:hypothetical protein MNV49_003454 [Pseudohyphozyma bogoriensis]|nr:hypothetical protein MNV49_003454 [Pseudohyphozyma bogoriensis]